MYQINPEEGTKAHVIGPAKAKDRLGISPQVDREGPPAPDRPF